MTDVFVTGIGIISAIGLNKEQNLKSLLNQQTGVGKIQILDTVHKNEFVAGEINKTNKELSAISGINNYEKQSRTTLLALIAAKEAVADAKIDVGEMPVAFISATTVGGMDITENFFDTANENTDNHFVITDYLNNHTEEVCRFLGIKHFATTISTACSSSANAIMLGARLIKSGQYKRVIVGGSDALSKFTLNGFNSLMILDKNLCRPFDENRKGLNLGEGAAYLVLESAELAQNKNVYGKISGYANANDAYHQTASSPTGDGASMAMQEALKVADLSPEEISYINVHGTATPNNDESEGTALQRVFGDKPPAFSSTKAFTGHTLAAAGAIEAVFSLLAIKEKIIYPNLNLETAIQKFPFSAERKLIKDAELTNVLSNSFGFGGNNTSIIYSK